MSVDRSDERSGAFHRKLVWVLVVALVAAHHDFWWWDSRALVLGTVPITLAYHAVFSLAAGALWIYAIFFAWPIELERWADEGEAERRPTAAGPGEGGR